MKKTIAKIVMILLLGTRIQASNTNPEDADKWVNTSITYNVERFVGFDPQTRWPTLKDVSYIPSNLSRNCCRSLYAKGRKKISVDVNTGIADSNHNYEARDAFKKIAGPNYECATYMNYGKGVDIKGDGFLTLLGTIRILDSNGYLSRREVALMFDCQQFLPTGNWSYFWWLAIEGATRVSDGTLTWNDYKFEITSGQNANLKITWPGH